METNNFEQEKKPINIIIEDKRFNREEIFSEPPSIQEEQVKQKGKEEAIKKEEPEQAEAPSAESSAEDMKERLVSVYEIGLDGYLKQSLGIFLNFAYVYMGLIANPEKGILTPDLGKAKLAIDSFEFVVDRLKASFSKEEQAELARILRDLKMNFMNAVTAGSPAQGASQKEGT